MSSSHSTGHSGTARSGAPGTHRADGTSLHASAPHHSGMPVLECHDLGKQYEQGNRRIDILKG
ncbi:MAG: hypothetical protein Q4D19_01475, partial [Lautropia sp.]|nr:hypothetical protein [Lautropia sp.]